MRILHIDEQRGWRGGEQQASYLVRGLAQRGHWVAVAGRVGGAFVDAEHGVADLMRIPLPFRGECDPWTAWRLACVVKRHSIDILHAHTSHAHTMACLARWMAGRGRVVVSRRVDFAPRAGTFTRWKYRCPDRIVAISSRIAEVMAAYGIEPDKLATVHSGIDPSRLDVSPISRAELGVPDDRILLGNVAALVGHKDQATLLTAFALAFEREPRLYLVIAGEGELRPRLEAQIAELGIGHAARLLGYRKDVPQVLRALDLFVMSSKEEGLGTSVLDAMACGVPVVATAGGGIPEMVVNGETGLLVGIQDPVALGEAIVQAAADPVKVAGMAQRAKAMVLDRFTVDAMVEGNIRVYRSLVDG